MNWILESNLSMFASNISIYPLIHSPFPSRSKTSVIAFTYLYIYIHLKLLILVKKCILVIHFINFNPKIF